MLNTFSFQLRFMELIKAKIPRHIGLPAVLAEILKLRVNSAYRRIRGEQLLSDREIELLSAYFEISTDEISQLDGLDYTGSSPSQPVQYAHF